MSANYGKDIHNGKSDRVFSGETENLKGIQEQWYKLYEVEDDKNKDLLKWTYEQVTEGDPEPFLAAIGEIRAIPAYRYVVNYILLRTELEIEKEDPKNFADYIVGEKRNDASADNKEFHQSDFQNLQQELISRLDHLFEQNGYEGKMDWDGFFSELSKSFCYESLKQMALGVHMSIDDFNKFLNLVLKRSRINFYNRDEIFIYLTLKYADQYGCGAYFKAYKSLCKLYPAKKKEDIPKMEWQDGGDDVSTKSLEEDLEKVFSDMADSLFEKKDPKLEEFLDYAAWQSIRLKKKDNTRTAKRRFCALWNEIKQRCDEEGLLAQLKQDEQEKKKIVDGVFGKELTVLYKPKTECFLPAGTKLKTKTKTMSIKGNDEAIFSLEQDYILPAVEMETVEVKVKALMQGEEFEQKKKAIPALAKLNQYIPAGSQMKVCTEELEKMIGKVTVTDNGKPRFWVDEGKPNEGILRIERKIGTAIPKGTQFMFESEGVRFFYESVEEVAGRSYAEAKVNAVWDNVEEFQQEVADKECTFLQANAKFTYDDDLENVDKIYAKKRITLKPVTVQDDGGKEYKGSNSALLRHIYRTSAGNAEGNGYYQGFPEYGDDYFLNTKLFKDTRIIRNHLTSPPNDEERLRNLILTLKFLQFVWSNDEYDIADAGREYSVDLIKDFGEDADRELTDCGFYSFCTNFAYDRFLALLLISYDPWILFQAIWSDNPLVREKLHRKEK